MTNFESEVSELSIDELDAVTGGNVVDTIVLAVETVAQIVRGSHGAVTVSGSGNGAGNIIN